MVAAFKATLTETREADLQLHVIDVADPRRKENIEQVQEAYPGVQKNIDKAVTKGILHKRTGSRYKSRLALSMAKTASS